jgi:hypothetical protein
MHSAIAIMRALRAIAIMRVVRAIARVHVDTWQRHIVASYQTNTSLICPMKSERVAGDKSSVQQQRTSILFI